MKYQELIYLIKTDLYRYKKENDLKSIIKNLLNNKGFKISFWYRVSRFYYLNGRSIPLAISKIIYRHYREKYCIDLSYKTEIASGLCLYHVFATAINKDVKIGKNIVISHGVTLGDTSRGEKKGSPVIGDNVVISPGAIIIGNVKVGNNVVIGGNCVVTKDVPDNAVVVGIPGKIISYHGTEGYLSNTDYETK